MKTRFIDLKVSIASYMALFNTYKVTCKEITDWSLYLETTLSNEEYNTIVLYGNRYLNELKLEDNGFLFNIENNEIRLVKNKSKNDLDKHILSYVNTDLLIEVLNGSYQYNQANQKAEEFI